MRGTAGCRMGSEGKSTELHKAQRRSDDFSRFLRSRWPQSKSAVAQTKMQIEFRANFEPNGLIAPVLTPS